MMMYFNRRGYLPALSTLSHRYLEKRVWSGLGEKILIFSFEILLFNIVCRNPGGSSSVFVSFQEDRSVLRRYDLRFESDAQT